MNSYRRGLPNGVLVNPKLFILEKVNFGPYIKCWSNLVKLSQTWSNVFKLVLFGAGHYSTPLPFPQELKAKKKAINQTEMLEVIRQVKVNIPLLDMIKQVPTYAKFLKDLCTVKRGLNVDKKAFLT